MSSESLSVETTVYACALGCINGYESLTTFRCQKERTVSEIMYLRVYTSKVSKGSLMIFSTCMKLLIYDFS